MLHQHRTLCPMCRTEAVLARITPGHFGFDIPTFEYPACNDVHQPVADLVDPMESPRTTGWRGFEAVEFATLEWVDWFNNRRLLEPIGNIPPAEAEQTGLLAALPFVFGGIGMVLLGQHSDRTMERKGHVAVALLMAAIGIGTSGLVSNPIIIMALLCFAQIGVSAVPAMFWPLPASFLTGASAAAGIAAINSLGNLSGFAGPFAMGYLKDLTGDFTVGLLLLAGCAVIGAAVVLSLRIDAKRERLSGGIALAN